MATLAIDGATLEVRLTPLEKVGALSGNVRVPLSSVREVHVTEEPYSELRGIRVGTGIPWVIVLGRMLHGGGKDFVAIYGTGRTAVIELRPGEPYRRIMISDADAAVVDELRARVSANAPSPTDR